jgi:guanylate kinase
MNRLISQGRFLEHAIFSANQYGTSKKAVETVMEEGKICILDVDLQGVKRIRKSDLSARYIFVRPKSLEILEKRLRDRGTESEEAIQKRLSRAREEWSFGLNPNNFDFVVVNDELDRAYNELREFIFIE